MRNKFSLLFLTLICTTTALLHGKRVPSIKNIDGEQVRIGAQEDLTELRAQIADQTHQIKQILATLCDVVAVSNSVENKSEICRALTLLRTFIEQLCLVITTMSEEELGYLVHANSVLLAQLQQQLSNGDLSKLNNFDAAQFSLLVSQKHALAEESTSLPVRVAEVKGTISNVWSLVTPLALLQKESTATPSMFQKASGFISDNRGYLCLAGILLALDSTIRLTQKYDLDTKQFLGGAMYKTFIYSLGILYLMRMKSDKAITDYANRWFGKGSFLGSTMITLKEWVGSPKIKKPALHIIAQRDMTAQEQLDWARAQSIECVPVELDRGRSSEFLRNFFEFEDGLVKIPLGIAVLAEMKKDAWTLANAMGGLPAALANFLFPEKEDKSIALLREIAKNTAK